MAKTVPGTLVVAAYNPAAARNLKLIVGGLWLASLALTYMYCKNTMTPGYAHTQAELAQAREDIVGMGISGGKPKRLEMATLLGEHGASELKYAFKYFQLFNGTLYLPDGFAAGAIQARMINDDGESADKEITWEAAKKAAGDVAS